MKLLQRACIAGGVLLSIHSTSAITLDIASRDSVKAAAKIIAADMIYNYTGNLPGGTPGILPQIPLPGGPQGYYWWEAGAMFGSLIDYWYYTGDDHYNSMIAQALLHQAGPNADYMPQNQTKNEGNDDQAFWAMAVLSAAETKFPNPDPDSPQWIALAQAVFNLQATRWDTTTCNGGLRWQIYWFNKGWDYKNSISQGCFFNIAARLGAYTGNATYFEWADKMWNWSQNVGLIDDNYAVYDGTDDLKNCTEKDHTEWTYNIGVFLYGSAVMWNQTNGTTQALWRTRIEGLLEHSKIFFTGASGQIMIEQACEANNNCNIDQKSFKAYLARWMAATTKVAPWSADVIMPYLRSSAQAAAASCVGAPTGPSAGSSGSSICGRNWNVTGWDGNVGVGEQMSALETVQSVLVPYVAGPVSNFTGGTSKGDPAAGTRNGNEDPTILAPITTADQAGAGILTAIVLIGILSGGWWIIS